MRVTEVATANALAPFVPEWSQLVESSPDGSFFETPEWISSWLEVFWAPRPAAVLLAHEEDALVGFAPFLADEHGDAWCPHTVTLPVHSQVPRASVVAAEGLRPAVLDAMLSHLAQTRRPPRVVLANIDSLSPVLPELDRAAERRGLASMRWPGPRMPWIRLSGSWDDYLQTRSSHVRSETRRKRRKLERAGRLEITVTSAADPDGATMRDVMDIERLSWKHESATSFDTEPGVGDFYEVLAKRAGDRGWLRIYVMHLDGEPIAHLYGIVYKNEYLALKTSYVQAQRALSPGSVLFDHVLQDAFAQGYRAIDLLGVESRWKNELSTDAREPTTTCVFSPLAVGCQACRGYQQAVKPVLVKRLGWLRRARLRGEAEPSE